MRWTRREKERRIDTLKYQIDELEAAKIQIGEMEELEARRKLLHNAERLTGAVNEAYDALYGGDSTDGVISLLGEAEGALSSRRDSRTRWRGLRQSCPTSDTWRRTRRRS